MPPSWLATAFAREWQAAIAVYRKAIASTAAEAASKMDDMNTDIANQNPGKRKRSDDVGTAEDAPSTTKKEPTAKAQRKQPKPNLEQDLSDSENEVRFLIGRRYNGSIECVYKSLTRISFLSYPPLQSNALANFLIDSDEEMRQDLAGWLDGASAKPSKKAMAAAAKVHRSARAGHR